MLRHLATFSLLLLPVAVSPSAFGQEVAEADRRQCGPGADLSLLEEAHFNVRVALVDTDDGVRLDAINLRPGPSEFLQFRKGEDGALVRSVLLPPLATTTVLEFSGMDRMQAAAAINAKWRLVTYLGAKEQVSPTPDYRYRLPFRDGARYRLTQGFGGTTSHQSADSLHALDFRLRTGEPVHAARGGVVIRAVDWFCQQGGRELLNQVNLIVILHEDGTMAQYAHLGHRQLLVEEGDRVERGQHIGYSGATGFAQGPHLHFVVRGARGKSIPIEFEGYEGRDLSKPGWFRAPRP